MPSRVDPQLVKRFIKEAGFPSLAAFGRHVGLSESTIGRVVDEKKEHNYNIETIELIAKALGKQPFELYRQEAIEQSLTAAAAEPLIETVRDAVTEAVMLVAPEISPQEAADALNNIPVSLPPALDPASYIDHIKQAHESEIASLRSVYEARLADSDRSNARIRHMLYAAIAILSAAVVYLLMLK